MCLPPGLAGSISLVSSNNQRLNRKIIPKQVHNPTNNIHPFCFLRLSITELVACNGGIAISEKLSAEGAETVRPGAQAPGRWEVGRPALKERHRWLNSEKNLCRSFMAHMFSILTQGFAPSALFPYTANSISIVAGHQPQRIWSPASDHRERWQIFAKIMISNKKNRPKWIKGEYGMTLLR
jgi:hypothetical protein